MGIWELDQDQAEQRARWRRYLTAVSYASAPTKHYARSSTKHYVRTQAGLTQQPDRAPTSVNVWAARY